MEKASNSFYSGLLRFFGGLAIIGGLAVPAVHAMGSILSQGTVAMSHGGTTAAVRPSLNAAFLKPTVAPAVEIGATGVAIGVGAKAVKNSIG